MKRDHNIQETNPTARTTTTSGGGGGSWSGEPSKTSSWHREEAGDDELMAVLGYKVKSSDMADIAQKLHLLEQVMNTAADEENPLSSDAVQHYNPSDLNSWLQSMISEMDPSSASRPNPFSSQDFGSDLTAIPGEAVLQPNKKLKSEASSAAAGGEVNATPPARPLVLVDSQENGIRLVHTLMACADAVNARNFKLAEALLNNIGFLAVSQAGAMRKVATYFAEALARIIYGLSPTNESSNYSAFTDLLQGHFYETCPYLKFAHFTANQAILEAFSGKKKVHVVDFGIKQGMQWPALLQALALQPGGPPSFRLTGIGPPSKDNTDYLQQVGLKLAQFAESINVEFQYRGFVVNSLADLNSSIFSTQEDETVAVNSIFELHQLLARPGGIEKVLTFVKELRPKIFTVVEQEANQNGPSFLDRFNESLHYYSTMFDSLESCNNTGGEVSDHDKVMSEVYLGRQICNVVACEGSERVERHESLVQWRDRLGSYGFEAVHLGSNAYKQASMLLALYGGGDGYGVEEKSGCLLLGWHGRPLIATSAWKL